MAFHLYHSMSASRNRWTLFVARHFLARERGSMSAPLVSIAVASIALGVLVMIMSVSILRGFQGEITRKVVGFGSHIVITSLTPQQYDAQPISTNRPDVERLRHAHGIRHMQYYATKGGMVKTDDQIHGIILKGVSADYDSSFFASCLTEGHLFSLADTTPSRDVIISQTIARKLRLAVGDRLRTYFWIGNTYRARAFVITGIYNTDLADFDEHYIIGDLRQVQRINGWQPDEVEGYELLVDNFDHLNATADQLLPLMDYDLALTTITAQNPALFAWLDLLNSNIVLIISIMALVCIVAIVSALLIMIFEKASTIGLLKTLGATNGDVRRIFLTKAVQIVCLGIAIGDAVALLLCLLQQTFHIVKLDSASYSMSFVPVDINVWIFLLVSIGSLAVCLAAMTIPASFIAKVQPSKSLRFE